MLIVDLARKEVYGECLSMDCHMGVFLSACCLYVCTTYNRCFPFLFFVVMVYYTYNNSVLRWKLGVDSAGGFVCWILLALPTLMAAVLFRCLDIVFD